MTRKAQEPDTAEVIVNQTIPIDDLEPHPRNYNLHPEAQIAQLRASLARFGQVRSIVVQSGAPGPYLVVAGHGLLEAARAHGLETLRADVIPPTWSAAQIDGYLVADNLTARGGEPDEDQLLVLLQEQQSLGYDLLTLGSGEDEIADLLAKLSPPSLGDLAAEYGDDVDDDAFWPIIRLKVEPGTKERFESLMAQASGSTEATKFAALLAAVDTASLAFSLADDDEVA